MWWSRSATAPSATNFVAISSNSTVNWVKPIGSGGFWTSTAHQQGADSRWTSAWLQQEDIDSTKDKLWLLKPELDLKDDQFTPYVINDGEDLDCLIRCYPPPLTTGGTLAPQWTRVAQDWIAITLTSAAVSSVATLGRVPNLCGWDCESTLWFRFPPGRWVQI